MAVLALNTKYTVGEGVFGGIIGGIALGIVSMIGSLIVGNGLLHPIILTGYAFQPYVSDPVLNSAILVKALSLHFAVSILGGLAFIFALNTFMSHRHLWFKGMIMGGLIWCVAVFGGIQTLDPTMAAHMNHIGFFLGFVAYGAAMGAFVERSHRKYRE